MLYNNQKQFEDQLKTTALLLDSTGKLAEFAINYLRTGNTPSEFLEWLQSRAVPANTAQPSANTAQPSAVPASTAQPSANTEESFCKYFTENPNWLLVEITYYLTFITVILFAEEQGVVKPGTRERFMQVSSLFCVAEEGTSSTQFGTSSMQFGTSSTQFGYVAKRLEPSSPTQPLLQDAKKLFAVFEKLATKGVFLVHGDFKLDNVLVNKEGRLCLIDFGFSTVQIRFGAEQKACGTAANVVSPSTAEQKARYLGDHNTQKACDLMFVDPLLFAITFSNHYPSPPPQDTTFNILHYYNNQGDFLDDMYNIAYIFFYSYHRKEKFVLDTHFLDYLGLHLFEKSKKS